MNHSNSAFLIALAGAMLLGASGCRSETVPVGPSSGGAGQKVEFSAADWRVIKSLAPAEFPAPPKDVSNQYADSANAVELGRSFFNLKDFSGQLLDIDNDGGPNALGRVGEVGKVACAGCHMAGSGFSDTRSTFQEISLGAGWTARRTPSLLDVSYHPIVHWGGRHSTLHSQVFGPFENPLEMNTSRLFVATYVADHLFDAFSAVFGAVELNALKDKARFVRLAPKETGCQLTSPSEHPRAQPPDPLYECHGMPGDNAEYDALPVADQEIVTRTVINVGKALAAFERTLLCGPGRFDQFAHGDSAALTQVEQRGLALFIGEGKCVSCHSGPHLTDEKFHNVGIAQTVTREGISNINDHGAAVDLPLAALDPLGIKGPFSDGDDGRLEKPLGDALEGAFRTPGLRCVSQRPSFFHDGLTLTVGSVVSLFNRGGDPLGYPGTREIEPLGLDAEERAALVAFLKAL